MLMSKSHTATGAYLDGLWGHQGHGDIEPRLCPWLCCSQGLGWYPWLLLPLKVMQYLGSGPSPEARWGSEDHVTARVTYRSEWPSMPWGDMVTSRPRLQLRAVSESAVLPQLGSVISLACGATKGHTDVRGLGHSLWPGCCLRPCCH